MPQRWLHVARVAATLRETASSEHVVAAGWLHDVGYAPAAARTGLHPLDGAHYLAEHGWSRPIVSLVAYHTGAEYEASERELSTAFEAFERPRQDELDLLSWADLTSGPTGEQVSVEWRLAEILERYSPGDPVHDAVFRSSEYLRTCAARGKQLADVRRSTVEAVADS
jgi:hypothetical protein